MQSSFMRRNINVYSAMEGKMGHELVCHYRGYGVYFDNATATYWSIAGGNFQTLTEALQCIDRQRNAEAA